MKTEIPIHKAVLLNEVINFLEIAPGKKYIDATLGQAGHSLEIAHRGGVVLGIDANPKTLDWVSEFLSSQKEDLRAQIKVVLGNFVNIDQIAREQGFEGVDGILFDLGLSTFELKNSGLGLSFMLNEVLDMRLNQNQSLASAADLVNRNSPEELYHVLTKYGEERDAHKIVEAIVKGRRRQKIKTTFDLAVLIESAYQSNSRSHDHLAKVFQALRIVVNGELENLEASLPKAFNLLKSGGRLEVVSFHSLEDRRVKIFFNDVIERGLGRAIVKNPVRASRQELEDNYSARSAKLRAVQKI